MNLPGVSVVVTAYSEKSKPYLDLCISSLGLMSSHYGGEVEIIIVSPKCYAPKYPRAVTISPPEDRYGCPRGLNFGIAAAKHEYIFVLNDDVIVTEKSLDRLMRWLVPHENLGILMPIGNDMQMRYFLPLPHQGPYRLEQAKDIFIKHTGAEGVANALIFHDTLCIYAYLMRKSVHDKIGGFDEKLISSDDIDFCIRLRNAGYMNAIAMNAVVWHAGGVTADTTFTDEMRVEGKRLFEEKWGGA